eukprot:357833-Chlamydomonas_euryale.AAC.2
MHAPCMATTAFSATKARHELEIESTLLVRAIPQVLSLELRRKPASGGTDAQLSAQDVHPAVVVWPSCSAAVGCSRGIFGAVAAVGCSRGIFGAVAALLCEHAQPGGTRGPGASSPHVPQVHACLRSTGAAGPILLLVHRRALQCADASPARSPAGSCSVYAWRPLLGTDLVDQQHVELVKQITLWYQSSAPKRGMMSGIGYRQAEEAGMPCALARSAAIVRAAPPLLAPPLATSYGARVESSRRARRKCIHTGKQNALHSPTPQASRPHVHIWLLVTVHNYPEVASLRATRSWWVPGLRCIAAVKTRALARTHESRELMPT